MKNIQNIKIKIEKINKLFLYIYTSFNFKILTNIN